MPDLDQIKQGEQGVRDGAGGSPGGGPAIPPAGRAAAVTNVNRAARLLLAGEGEALTRKAVELALAGDPVALRLCLERIVGRIATRGRIHDAADPQRQRPRRCDGRGRRRDGAGCRHPARSDAAGTCGRGLCPRSRSNEFERRLRALERPMPRPLDTRLDRVEGRRMAAAAERGSDAIRRRRMWRAEAAMGAVIRNALARAGVDAAAATVFVSPTKPPLPSSAIPDTPELQGADGNGAAAAHKRSARADAFAPKILAQAQGFVGGRPPDFAKASFRRIVRLSLASRRAE